MQSTFGARAAPPAKTTIALSLTEDYAPQWGVWEGVRELVQNWHDGCLRGNGRVEWVRNDANDHVARIGSVVVGSLTYNAAEQQLVLVNRDVGLARRVLLLGSSHKADSQEAIGQFGEGMKVGTLALLREGRQVDMCTRDEHWHWCRRVDASFGVRVLTVEVQPRGSVEGALLVEEDDDQDVPRQQRQQQRLTAALGEADTSTLVSSLTAPEWEQFCTRFLFLTPPTDSFSSSELGELLLDPQHMGQLFVKGVWVTNGKQDHNLGSGLNLYHMRLDRDRRAVVHSSDLESQAAALWGTCLRLIANLEQRLQKRVIVVGSQLLSILQQSNRIPSLDILKAQEEAQAAAAHEAPVAWTAIGEEGAAIARRCAAILCAAGATHFELGLIDLVAGEVDPEAERARAQEQHEGPSTTAALLEGMAGMPPRPPPRIRVPSEALLNRALAVLLNGWTGAGISTDIKADAHADAKESPATLVLTEAARRELLLRRELHAQEQCSKAQREEHADEVRAIQKELDALRSQLMKMEVAQMNELEKQRLRAQADAEMLSLVMTIANELREERDAHRCCVCMVTERSALLLPCKHAVLCQPCAATVRGSSGRCPLCRMGIEDVIQIFS
ncbi:sap DNA-binding domain-containing protein [Chrysochromulina tobinii]|uniref:Sap DNA-binding domain-containing protein n=1 Tax=Chrysochromulina tobinii TaxID=1460289 RepID=A0A0M0K2G7_9EUKA|nr:sap DNA-binding domain-containing protein [Chrysochromulina tobinii]|eukprot:KOO32995.1 sap DNA-binding domain-containing protein [Chrysochromulina sp. CCMP291]